MLDKQDYIIDSVGAENWQQVVSEFAGKTLQQVKDALNLMFTSDNNDDLAKNIYDEVN